MKAMKIALLGTAALAAVSISARADELSDLKAQIEALNARVASVETAPSLPAGYQAVSFSKVGNNHVISIMPTADLPAATTVTWSGYVRVAALLTREDKNGPDFTDIVARAYLTVEGKTDTAVGEVGAKVKLMWNTYGADEFNGNSKYNYFRTDGFWGWWKVTPNLTFGGGVDGSLAKNSYTYDAAGAGDYYNSTIAISNNPEGDPAQFRLSYSDGPLGVAIAVEDYTNDSHYPNGYSSLGVAGKVTYAADAFAVDVSGGYWASPSTVWDDPEAAWVIDAGAQFSLSSAFQIGGAIGIGSGNHLDDDYTAASVYANVGLGDTITASVGFNETWYTQGTTYQSSIFDAGLYYNPVSKLTLGVEGSYTTYSDGRYGDGSYNADFVSIWRF